MTETNESGKKKTTAGKRLLSLTAVLLLLVTTLSLLPLPTSAIVTEADIKAMEEKIKKNESTIASYQKKIASLKKDLTDTIALKNELDGKIAAMQENISDTNLLIQRYRELIDQKIVEISHSETDYDEDYATFLDLMRVYYEDNTTNPIDLILSADSFDEFLTQAERIGSLLSLEQTLMKELNQETADLKNMKTQLLESQKRAEELKASQEQEQANLDRELEETQKLIDSLNKDQSIAQKSLAQAQAMDKQLDADLTKLLKALEEQKKTQYVGGTLGWPVDPELNYISSKYGWRTVFGKQDYHLGVDIIRRGYNIYGANIYAANDGEVVTATSHSSYGNYVLINHGGGYATLYAHCSQLLVKAGDKVKKGQIIAKIGSTGQSTGNHLHFEVRINGSTVNPLSGGYVAYPKNLTIAP